MPSSENSRAVTGSIVAGHKKPYAPPKLTSIKLRPEEAVLGGCKTAGGAGTLQTACALCSGLNIAS
jgi:hypothetical protein